MSPVGAIGPHVELESTGVDSMTFRRILRSFPAGVTVVSSHDSKGAAVGMTATAVASASLVPPQLLVCLGEHKYTLAAIRERGVFAVSFLAASQSDVAELFAASVPDKFDLVSWHAGAVTGAPVVSGALAHAECEVSSVYETGDHDIVVGLIVSGDADVGPALTYYSGSFNVAWD